MADQSPKPVYVLRGTDDYLRRRYRGDLIGRLLAPDQRDLALYDTTADAELSDVLDELRTAPLLAQRRVVVIRDADPFVKRYRKQLEAYLESPSGSGSLILIVSSWQSTTRLAKRVAEIGEVLDCSSPSAARLPRWIAKAVGSRSKAIAPEAADVTVDDVAAVVAAATGPEPFALTNAIEAGDRRKALEALGALMTVRGEEFRTLGMIGWMLRSALSGKGGYRRQRRPPDSPAAIVRKFRHALRADLAMKSGADPLTTMQLLVTKLCA